MKYYPRTLVIGDPHAEPGHNNKRFTALGNYIVETQPDTVLCIGDFTSFDSLSDHDEKRPLLKEGRRLVADIRHAQDALARIDAPMSAYNARAAAGHRERYKPRLIMVEGNHEDRANRYVASRPELSGVLDIGDLIGASEYGWEIIPYKSYYYLYGVGFTHIPMAKRDGNMPLSGEYIAKRVIDLHNQTTVFGHTHRFVIHDLARNQEGQSKRIMGINCGWFGDFMPSYARGGAGHSDWWSGLIELTHLSDEGDVDVSSISMDRLKAEYL